MWNACINIAVELKDIDAEGVLSSEERETSRSPRVRYH
jgi:hypothetical protein